MRPMVAGLANSICTQALVLLFAIQLREFPYRPSLTSASWWIGLLPSRYTPEAVALAPALANATFLPSAKISSSSTHGSARLARAMLKRINRAGTGSKTSSLPRAFTGGLKRGIPASSSVSSFFAESTRLSKAACSIARAGSRFWSIIRSAWFTPAKMACSE